MDGLIKTKKDLIEALKGRTPFEKRVYMATYEIPKGKVSTYRRIAKKIGNPKACRAVANALHKNPFSPLVPCHRVVGFDGSFRGEQQAANRRRDLVRNEGVPIEKEKVRLDQKILF